MVNYKTFYEGYHRRRLLPKRVITRKNFTYRHILKVIEAYIKGRTVLDFGSGVGTIALYLAKQGYQVTGVEISQKAVKIAKQSAKRFSLGKQVRFLRADIFKTKLREKFDLVICSEVLEHLPDDHAAVARVKTLLTKNGLALFSVPSINAPLIKTGSIRHFDQWSGHLRRYSLDRLTQLLFHAGFRVIFSKKNEGIIRDWLFVHPLIGNQIIRLANRFGIISDLITLIDNVTLKLLGESQIIVIAKPTRKP